ncbi:chloride channel protein [Flavihumibacter rivuli]|uniref:chloride channel protein n=1 Tax=Flavihumibacter rivuli TaxID=2838156 RepID=UPI001BDF31BB|nr:chloride channel protein [Flavihumibacter rivuli]ULQ55646.1 chloride channel protein [Flavihumibacter rivuli]
MLLKLSRPVVARYQAFIGWMRLKLNRVQFMVYTAILTGIVTGLAAVGLKSVVHLLQEFISQPGSRKFTFAIFPILGLIITVIITRLFFNGFIEKGIGMVLRSVARKNAFIPLSDTYKHLVTASITVGMGGSAGLEAPIVATGSAIGSNTARIHQLDFKERSLILACGAAAGISAVFNAPVAGVIFAIEILLTETIVSYFIPLIIASVTGALCSHIILKESILFNFKLKQAFDYHNVPFYILLGLMAGFTSLYYARVFKKTEHGVHQLIKNPYLKALIAGCLLAILIIAFPPLLGEGYPTVGFLANGEPEKIIQAFLYQFEPGMWGLLLIAGAIILLKPVAAGITIGGGGNGGNFAPSLFVGAYLGFFLSRITNLTKWFSLPEGNFSLAGMAGVLSGIMYCPLTAIFLIAEITNGYELFIPLMIVSSISFFIVKHFEPYSMETKKLVREGQVFTHKKEDNILQQMHLGELVQDEYERIGIDKKLSDLVALIKSSNKNIFAVVNNEGKFQGIIELNDIKKTLFEPRLFERTTVKELMKKPPATIFENESMKKAMDKMDYTQSWYLPVLDKDKRFLGFLSKTRIFEKYRESLAGKADLYDEEEHEP